jgi:nitrous oxide reductase accessory protein NosL
VIIDEFLELFLIDMQGMNNDNIPASQHVQSGVLMERPADPGQLEVLKTAAIARINRRAGEIITTQLPQWKQANLTARAIELQSIGAANWSVPEAQEWQDTTTIWDWIKSIRAQSNVAVDAVSAAASESEIATIEAGAFA